MYFCNALAISTEICKQTTKNLYQWSSFSDKQADRKKIFLSTTGSFTVDGSSSRLNLPMSICYLNPGPSVILRLQSRRSQDPSYSAGQSTGTISGGRRELGEWRRPLSAGWRWFHPPCPVDRNILLNTQQWHKWKG